MGRLLGAGVLLGAAFACVAMPSASAQQEPAVAAALSAAVPSAAPTSRPRGSPSRTGVLRATAWVRVGRIAAALPAALLGAVVVGGPPQYALVTRPASAPRATLTRCSSRA